MRNRKTVLSILVVLLFSFISFLGASEPLAVQEVVGLRDDHTRVWEYVHQEQVTDSETGITSLVPVQSYVSEKADNLCYNLGTKEMPNWEPVEESFTDTGVGYRVDHGAYQVVVSSQLTNFPSVQYTING